MGIFSKISKKIGDKIEQSAVNHMTDEQKQEYEKELEEKQKNIKTFPNIEQVYTKEETSDLEALLIKAGAVDDLVVWVGGFLKLRENQNPKFANLFSGHKNLRFLTYNNGVFYMLHFEKNVLKSHKAFDKTMVRKVELKKELRVVLYDKTTMNLHITKNKTKASALVLLIKD